MNTKLISYFIVLSFLLTTSIIFVEPTPAACFGAYVPPIKLYRGTKGAGIAVDNITQDGSIINTPAFAFTDYGNLSVWSYKNSGDYYRGYIEFNFSEVPDNAVIVNATLWFNRSHEAGMLDDWFYINRVDVQPSLSTAQQIWDNMAYTYTGFRNFEGEGPINVTKTLWEKNTPGYAGSEAKFQQLLSDLNDAISTDWFAFGFDIDISNLGAGISNICTEELGDGDNPNPDYQFQSPMLYLHYYTELPEYRINLRYENTSVDAAGAMANNYINITQFNCSTHRLDVHHTNGTLDTYYLDYTDFTTNDNTTCYFDIESEDVLYFEFFWNYSIDTDCSDCIRSCQYSRILTPHAATPVGTADWNLTFYLITDRHVYNEFYGYNTANDPANFTNCSGLIEYNLTDNLVQFDFDFDDRSHIFDTKSGFDSWTRFYTYNNTQKLIIHEEYWDSQQQVHPTLIFEKEYYVGINSSDEDGYLYENIGSAPNNQWAYPYEARTIIINDRGISTENVLDNYELSYGWESNGTGLWVSFWDFDLETSYINMSVYNMTLLEPLFTDDVTTFHGNFSYGNANQNFSYYIELNITQTFENTYGQIVSQDYSFSLWIYPEQESLQTSEAINTTFTTIFGNLSYKEISPGVGYHMDYNNIIIGILFIIVFGTVGTYASIGAGIFAGGIAIMGYGVYVSGLLSILPYAGIFIMFIGILLLLSGEENL